MSSQLRNPRVLLALLAVYIIWGTTYFAIRVALESMPPLFLMGSRFVAAGLLLLGFLVLRGARLPSIQQTLNAAKVGFLLLSCGMGAVALAEQSISSSATTALAGALPLFAALAAGLDGKWPRGPEWLALALGSVGIVVLAMGEEFRASVGGTALILFAIASWSFGAQWSLRMDLPEGMMGFALEMLFGGLVLLLVSASVGETWQLQASSSSLAAWAYLVVFGSLIAFSAYMFLTRAVSPALSASYAYVNPPVALLVGAGLGGEQIARETLLGLPLILAAVALLAKQSSASDKGGAQTSSRIDHSAHSNSSGNANALPVNGSGKGVRASA